MFRIIFFALFIAFGNSLFSMDVIGKIVDNQGTPIVDAYILNADGSFHASSNELGIFTCTDAHIGDTLVISYLGYACLLYTSPSPRDATLSRMPSSA